MGDQQAPIGEVFDIEGASSYKYGSVPLITIIINKWHTFVKFRFSSFIWCNSYHAHFTHEWLKIVWREVTKKSFGGRYLNFKEEITFLESSISALSYDTSIRNSEPGISKFCLFKVVLAFPQFDYTSSFSLDACRSNKQSWQKTELRFVEDQPWTKKTKDLMQRLDGCRARDCRMRERWWVLSARGLDRSFDYDVIPW